MQNDDPSRPTSDDSNEHDQQATQMGTPERRLRVFVADDDLETRRMIAMCLRQDGHVVVESSNGGSLLLDLSQIFRGPNPDTSDTVVVADGRMPERDGMSVLRSMRQYPWCPPFILTTASGGHQFHDEARRRGAHAVLDKPFALEALLAAIYRASRSRRHETSD